jgi:acyl-CoA thioester hydrolase
MGFAYYGVYAAWLEVGRVEYLRDRGLIYRDIEDLGKLLAVHKLEIDYLSPAKYDDLITVRTRVTALSKSRIDFESEIVHSTDNHLIARGRVGLACLDPNGRPQRIGKELAEACAPSS